MPSTAEKVLIALFVSAGTTTSGAFLAPKPRASTLQPLFSTSALTVEDKTSRASTLQPLFSTSALTVEDMPISSDDNNVQNVPALEKFSSSYQQLTTDHYLPMAFAQAGVLASAADIITQTLECSSLAAVHYPHVLAMATVASTMSGALNAVWLKQLEAAFPGKGGKEVFYKTMIHAVILASIINSAYLVGVPYLSAHLYEPLQFGMDMDTTQLFQADALFSGWKMDEFITLTKLEICMFIPYNTLAFKFVPPSVRPLTHAAVSATFNVAVSAVTLGYFDKWVENAMSVLS